jgi:uncharacterized protein (DUF3084 family)
MDILRIAIDPQGTTARLAQLREAQQKVDDDTKAFQKYRDELNVAAKVLGDRETAVDKREKRLVAVEVKQQAKADELKADAEAARKREAELKTFFDELKEREQGIVIRENKYTAEHRALEVVRAEVTGLKAVYEEKLAKLRSVLE